MQKNCGIGGQALIEGIMMRNRDRFAMAARRENGEIVVEEKPYKSVFGTAMWTRLPIVRGAVAFIDSLVVGISSLMWSADISAEEEETEAKTEEEKRKDEKTWNALMTGTMVFSLAFSVFLFVLLPFWLAGSLRRIGMGEVAVHLLEALLRIAIFLGYMLLISQMKDIQRTFSYHGAEHKCINCIENGLDLTVENVMKSSRQHRRCGTSFLLITVMLSVVVFLLLGLLGLQSGALRLVIRLLLIPLIAGISFEFLRYTGSHEGKLVDLLVQPGLQLQRLVTNEPDEAMCEVAIAAIEAVFDWRAYQGKKA